MNYPVYRKYNGADTWFKIISADEFIELKRVGTKWQRTRVLAEKFPEKQFIQDMLTCHENRWIELDSEKGNKLFDNFYSA